MNHPLVQFLAVHRIADLQREADAHRIARASAAEARFEPRPAPRRAADSPTARARRPAFLTGK